MGDFDQKILSMLREATATDDYPASFSKDVNQAADPKAQSVDKKWPVEGKVADDDVDVVAEDDMPADDVDDEPKDVVTESDDDDEDDVVDGDEEDFDDDDDEEDDDDQTFSEMISRLREAPDDPETPEGEIDTNESVKEEQEGEVGKTEPKEEPFQESKKKKVKESKGKAKGKKIAEGEVPDAFKKQWAKNSDDADDKEDVKEDTDDMPDFLKKKLDKDGDGEPDVKESTLTVAEAADDDDDDVKKDTDAMFEGQSLPEDFRKKATIVFEAAVKTRAAAARKRYAEEATSKLKEAYDVLKKKSEARIATTEKKLAEQVDQYLTYVAGQWMKENRLAIEAGIRAELAEDFIGGLKKLFVEHYIEVPQSKVDVVKMMGKKLAKMEARVNEQAKENLKLRESMNRYRREEIVRGASKGLTDIQADKLRKVTEGITFTSKEQFSSAVTTLKESYFPKEKPKGTLVEEDTKKKPAPAPTAATEPLTEDLSVYVQALNSRKS